MYICYGPSYSWRPVYFLADLLEFNETRKKTLPKFIGRIPAFRIRNAILGVAEKFEYNFAKYMRGAINASKIWNPLFFNSTCKARFDKYKINKTKKVVSVPAEITISKIQGDDSNLRSELIMKALKKTKYILNVYTMEERDGAVIINAEITLAEF